METIEIAAPTVDEALEQAASKLGVDKAALTYAVIEETKGLFGKGQVRVSVQSAPEDGAPKKKTRAKKEAPAPEPEVVEEPKAPAKRKAAAKKTEAAPMAEEAGESVVATKEDAERLQGLMNSLLDDSGLSVHSELVEMTGKYVNLSLKGDDAGYLVGRRGEVLNALQYLMNVISARQFDNGVRVVVDADDYRSRRKEVLEKLAFDIAAEVKKRGEEAVLDALPAFERRLIHQALTEFEGVTTYSEGEEPERRVVIAPSESSV